MSARVGQVNIDNAVYRSGSMPALDFLEVSASRRNLKLLQLTAIFFNHVAFYLFFVTGEFVILYLWSLK